MVTKHHMQMVMVSVATLLLAGIVLRGQESPRGSQGLEEKVVNVPRLVTFSGMLKDRSARPVSGVVGVTFSVYRDQDGGAPLWTENQNLPLDEQGRYNVMLGAMQNEGLPLDLFTSGEARWLGVQAQLPGEEEQPRVLIVSVPYALRAADADTLGGRPASAYALAKTEELDGSRPSDVAAAAKNPDEPVVSALSGTGTANRAVKWTGTETQGDASIVDVGVGTSMTINSANNVGVGTDTPTSRMHVRTAVGDGPDLTVENQGSTFYTGGAILLKSTQSSVRGGGLFHFNSQAQTTWFVGNPYGTTNGKLQIGFRPGSAVDYSSATIANALVTVQSNGNFGIGTSSPTAKLDVVGGVRGSQLISTASQGTQPMLVSSTTRVDNLNASLLDSRAASSFLTRGITYLGGCDTCGVLLNTDDQKTIYANVFGQAMTLNSVTCFSDAGAPQINLKRQVGVGVPAEVLTAALPCSTTGASTSSFLINTLNADEKLDFEMVTAGGVAKRVTVAIKATVN